MVSCVLWDFGDTLADERWLAEPSSEFPRWADHYRETISLGRLGAAWHLGNTSTQDVAAHLAASQSVDRDQVAHYLRRRCADIFFHENAMQAVRSCVLPQAIVTINPDIFSECVVPNYELHEMFETIVTSWEERTLDKSDLCDVALKRLGIADRRDALLIDNLVKNVEGWRARGGLAHHFTGDDDFAANPPAVFESIF